MALVWLTEDDLVGLSLGVDGIYNLVTTLIWDNLSIVDQGGPHFESMTEGQKAVALAYSFNGELLNGGLSQYLFNRPDELLLLLDVLPALKWTDLEQRLDTALGELTSQTATTLITAKESFGDSVKAGDQPSAWSAFRDWADTIDDDAFNDWFYEHQEAFDHYFLAMIWRLRADLITNEPSITR